MHLHDVDLVRRLLADDPTVLDELFVDLWPVIAWRIKCRFRRLFDQDDLDDLGQETFLLVWRNRAKYDADRGSVSSWVASIALNRAGDASRRHARKQRRSEHGTELDLLESLLHAAPHLEVDVCEVAEDVLRLREALAELTERQRAIVMACYAGNGDPPTSRELAAEFHTTPAAVRMDLSRAKAKIRAHFEAARCGEPKKSRSGGG
jgi:RNA polymerase sigma-70 factor, ECF subfamily